MLEESYDSLIAQEGENTLVEEDNVLLTLYNNTEDNSLAYHLENSQLD